MVSGVHFMTVYNMKRSLNILGFENLMQKLNAWKPEYQKEWLYPQKMNNHKCFIATLYFETKMSA